MCPEQNCNRVNDSTVKKAEPIALRPGSWGILLKCSDRANLLLKFRTLTSQQVLSSLVTTTGRILSRLFVGPFATRGDTCKFDP